MIMFDLYRSEPLAATRLPDFPVLTHKARSWRQLCGRGQLSLTVPPRAPGVNTQCERDCSVRCRAARGPHRSPGVTVKRCFPAHSHTTASRAGAA